MKLILATLHSRYTHVSLALPSLAAACSEVPHLETSIREYTIHRRMEEVLRELVGLEAECYAFSCYIWNIQETLRLVTDLKQVVPGAVVILGGPEVSHSCFSLMEENPAVDFVIRGEGEEALPRLMTQLVSGGAAGSCDFPGIVSRTPDGVIALPDLATADVTQLRSPFALGLVDLSKKLVYLETARGCPFDCAFCMSSLEGGVRPLPDERIFDDLERVMAAEVPVVKLVDRTFNYDRRRADRIWNFILERNRSSIFHFEIAADLLDDENLRTLARVPEGMFRFEIGVQSVQEETLEQVSRKSDLKRLFANVRRLREETRVLIHLDLVAGLPGETLDGFRESLRLLLQARPHHIQVEPLKVLKGSRMRRIARELEYSYSPHPPYRILRTPSLSYEDICRIEDMARLVDLVWNSGTFNTSLGIIGTKMPLERAFEELAAFVQRAGTDLGVAGQTAVFGFISAWGREKGIEFLDEALSHDFLLRDFPPEKLPPFFGTGSCDRGRGAPPGSAPEGDATGGRLRYFRRRYAIDLTESPPSQRETEITYLYHDLPGTGLRVTIRKRYT